MSVFSRSSAALLFVTNSFIYCAFKGQEYDFIRHSPLFVDIDSERTYITILRDEQEPSLV